MLQRLGTSLAMLAALAALAAPASARGTTTVSVRAMTFNIFYGGDELNLRTNDWCTRPLGCQATFRKVLTAIRRSGADIVGLQEPGSNTARIARALGWHGNVRTSVISRFALVDPSGGGGEYVYAEIAPGRFIAVASTHLTSDPYGPYAVRDGASAAAVRRLERRVRVPDLAPHLRALPPLIRAGVPVVLTGDFNSPSHLDWTPAVADARPVVRYPFRWPVGVALARAGLRDTYREAHPDAVADPGYTWTPGGLESVPDEVHDRIDWVLAGGPVRTLASTVVGEPGGPGVGVALDPWPSDHRGVVSTLRVRAASAPSFVALASRRVALGTPIRARFHRGPDGRPWRVALVRAGGRQPIAARPARGTGRVVSFPTAGLRPRAYDVVLAGRGGRELGRTRVWLHRPGAGASISTAKRVYAQGEPITVRWRNAPGMHWDWVGLYRAGAGGHPAIAPRCFAGVCGNGAYLGYAYTDAAPGGRLTLDGDSFSIRWPLRPGRYEVRLLLDDGYRSVAWSRPFRVAPG
jgi:endonuclease/exonuclease/phosphatase family metal-dependent hydrolase